MVHLKGGVPYIVTVRSWLDGFISRTEIYDCRNTTLQCKASGCNTSTCIKYISKCLVHEPHSQLTDGDSFETHCVL